MLDADGKGAFACRVGHSEVGLDPEVLLRGDNRGVNLAES